MLEGIRPRDRAKQAGGTHRLLQPLDLDQLQTERLDLLEQPVELRLIADLAAQRRLRRLDRGREVLEDLGHGVA